MPPAAVCDARDVSRALLAPSALPVPGAGGPEQLLNRPVARGHGAGYTPGGGMRRLLYGGRNLKAIQETKP